MKTIWDSFNIKNPALFNNLKIVDLHLHSHYSDGTVYLRDLLNNASEFGYSTISLTDHNTIEGYNKEAYLLAKKLGIQLVAGAEIDCGQGLDLLVYDNDLYNPQTNFLLETKSIADEENNKRFLLAQKCIDDIVGALDEKDYDWLNWKAWDEIKKQKFIHEFTIKNLLKINLKTRDLEILNRTFISKTHILMLLVRLELFDVIKVCDFFGADDQKLAFKQLKKLVFKEFCHWELDESGVDENLIHRLRRTNYKLILAHPGKAFEDSNPSEFTQKSYTKFVEDIFVGYKLNGIEAQYRNYKEMPFDYNKIAFDTIIKFAKKQEVFVTAGSDSHNGIKK